MLDAQTVVDDARRAVSPPPRAAPGRPRRSPPRTAVRARALRRPASTTIESPSKTSSSWPPIIARYAVVQPASWARLRTSSSRVSCLSRSYGEALTESSSPAPARTGRGHPAAVLPQVLADGEGDVDAVDADDGQRLAGHEVAELVEDAVVGQVVLGEGQRHLAAVQHGGGVLRGAGRAGRSAALARSARSR